MTVLAILALSMIASGAGDCGSSRKQPEAAERGSLLLVQSDIGVYRPLPAPSGPPPTMGAPRPLPAQSGPPAPSYRPLPAIRPLPANPVGRGTRSRSSEEDGSYATRPRVR